MVNLTINFSILHRKILHPPNVNVNCEIGKVNKMKQEQEQKT